MATIFTRGHAVIIGVGDDLPNTVDDAIGLADILKDSGRCAYPAGQVQLLTGEGATRNHILNALEWLTEMVTAEATAVVYFSGHGYRVQTAIGEAYYLMPFGYDLSKLYETAVSGQELATILQAIPAGRILLLLDCCHAGGLDGSKAGGLNLTKAPLPPQTEALFTQGSGRVAIASSRANELSYAGKPYSAFTLALIEALVGVGTSKEDGYVRVADLALHTRQMVPQRTQERQHPILHFEQADNFILAYYAGGDSQPKGLPFTVDPTIESKPGEMRQQIAHQARFRGGGAIAQGHGAVAVGERGVHVGGKVDGSIVTGNRNVLGHQIGDTRISAGDILGQMSVASGSEATSTVTRSHLVADTIEFVDPAFVQLHQAVAESQVSPAHKIVAQQAIEKLGEQAQLGEAADEAEVQQWFNVLATMLPDIAEVAVDTFLSPIKGLGTAFRKIAARAREQQRGSQS
jgi:hypothetical protein